MTETRRKARRSQLIPSDMQMQNSDIYFGASGNQSAQNWNIMAGFREVKDERELLFDCPFEQTNTLTEENYVQIFDAAITAVFNDSDPEFSAVQLQQLSELISMGASCRGAHEFVANKLMELAASIPAQMSELGCVVDIGEFWHKVKAKVNFIKTAFSPLCLSHLGLKYFQAIFDETIKTAWTENSGWFNDITQIILEAYAASREEGDTSVIEPAFKFARESGVFHEGFVHQFTWSVVSYLTPIIDELFTHELSEYLKAVSEIDHSEKSLAEPLLVDDYAMRKLTTAINDLIFKSKLDNIYERLNGLIENCDVYSIDLCAEYARATDTISMFARELSFEIKDVTEKCFKKPNSIQEVMKVHNALTKCCAKSFANDAQNSRILKNSFENGLNASPEASARLLAEEIHRKFIEDAPRLQPGQSDKDWPFPDEVYDQLISIFRSLAERGVFEAYHHLLMSRRILMMKNHIIRADEIFLEKLKKQCGEEYTKRLNTIFEDLRESLETTREFQALGSNTRIFNALVLMKDAWPTLDTTGGSISAPPEIMTIMDQFTTFFKSKGESRKIQKKLQWNLPFTRVKLAARNLPNVTQVRCSGLYAMILLVFNELPVADITEIERRTDFPKELVEKLLRILKSKKLGKLLMFMHHRWRVNIDNKVEGGCVSIPFTFPSLPPIEDSAKRSIQQNRAHQVDAAVMLVMKREKSMEKAEMRAEVKKLLNFRLDDELYESRLAHLERITYLKLDPSGHVHYLP